MTPRRRRRRFGGTRMLRLALCGGLLLISTIGLLLPISIVRAANEDAPIVAAGLLQSLAGAAEKFPVAASAQPAPAAALLFTRHPDVAAAVLARLTHHDEKKMGEAAAALDQSTIVESATAWFARYGLSVDNLADVMTAYWVESWEVANRKKRPDTLPSPRAVLAVEDSLKRALTANSALLTLDDDKKEIMADTMIDRVYLASRKAEALSHEDDKTARAIFIAGVNAPFRAAGVDLQRLELTEEGFLRR